MTRSAACRCRNEVDFPADLAGASRECELSPSCLKSSHVGVAKLGTPPGRDGNLHDRKFVLPGSLSGFRPGRSTVSSPFKETNVPVLIELSQIRYRQGDLSTGFPIVFPIQSPDA